MERHDYQLGEERTRVRAALTLAAAGKQVALVCSGDPGIYAMASLVFEEMERAGEPGWERIAIDVLPGVSALIRFDSSRKPLFASTSPFSDASIESGSKG